MCAHRRSESFFSDLDALVGTYACAREGRQSLEPAWTRVQIPTPTNKCLGGARESKDGAHSKLNGSGIEFGTKWEPALRNTIFVPIS